MLCTRGIRGCSMEPNQSMYMRTSDARKLASANPTTRLHDVIKDVATSGCLANQQKKSFPVTLDASRVTPGCLDRVRLPRRVRKVKRSAVGCESESKTGQNTGLGCSSRLPSGLVPMSPWNREVLKRAPRFPCDESDKENSVISSCLSSQANQSVSISNLSNVSNISRYGRFGIRGQLKVDINSTGDGILLVRVHEAKHLKQSDSERTCFYSQASLVPDDGRFSTYVTRVVRGTQNPVFDETFRIHIGEKDRKRRIVLSVRQMRPRSGRSELVGCMSFGIRHILARSKQVGGWFYLLNDELGKRKHLRVLNSATSISHESAAEYDIHNLSNADVSMETASERDVTGSSSTKSASPLHERPTNTDFIDMNDGFRQPKMRRLDGAGCSAHGYPEQVLDSLDEEVEIVRATGDDHMVQSAEHRHMSISIMASSANTVLSSGLVHSGSTTTSARSKTRPLSTIPSTPSLQTPGGPQNTPSHSFSTILSSSYYDSTGQLSWLEDEDEDEDVCDLRSVEEDCWGIVADLDNNNVSKDMLSSTISTTFDSTLGVDMTSTSCKWHHFDCLLDAENTFVQRMQEATQRFSRPLRHHVLTHKQHKTLFQNIEKLVAIAHFHVRRLRNATARHQMEVNVDVTIKDHSDEDDVAVGDIYMPQLGLFCEAYTAYCNGLPKALELLDQLTDDEKFRAFIQKCELSEKELDIVDFIRLPVVHIEDLLEQFDSMLLDLPLSSQDFEDVRTVRESLRACLPSTPDNSLRYSSDSGISRTSLAARTVSQTSLSTVFSVDQQVADIQNRLVFPSSMQAFQVAVPNRQVVLSDAMYMVDGWKWTKVQMTLFSDAILVTRLDASSNTLTAIREPTPLRDVIGWDFSRYHPCEFEMSMSSVDDDSCSVAGIASSLVLRAACEEQKLTWSRAIQQRIRSCRSQREYAL